MRVRFLKDADHRLCRWDAVVGKRTRVPGPTMGLNKHLPHDLAQYVIEAGAGERTGFWGCIAQGATFRSTGRKRTKPGRAVIARHRREIVASEHLANAHMVAWLSGERTDVTRALEQARKQWKQLRRGEALVYEWPDTRGTIEPA
jgi:hypothetical protein